MMCRHPKLTEADNMTLVDFEVKGQQGSVTGAFQWKKYTCNECSSLITVLHAVVEEPRPTMQPVVKLMKYILN